MSDLIISPEGVYTDIEHDFIENEPPGLLPGGQDSTWGQIRATYAAELQAIADTMTKWYNNLDPATVSSDDLPEWEYMLNLPQSNTALSDTARRNNVVARSQVGPFTRTRRRQIVESFIEETFGDAAVFDPTGIPFSSGGIPLYSGESSLAGLYTIRENQPVGKNMVPNSTFETGLAGWDTAQDAGMTINDFSQSAAWSMYGTKSLHAKWTNANDNTFRSAQLYSAQAAGGMPITPGASYTFSCYLNVINPPGNTISVFIFWYKANGTPASNNYAAYNYAPSTQGQVSLTAQAPPDAAFGSVLVDFTTQTPGDVIEAYIDGVQFELVTKNLIPNPGFDNDVSGWADTNVALALSTVAAPPFGVYTCQVLCTTNTPGEMHTNPLPIIPGLPYTFSAYIGRWAGVRLTNLSIQWYNDATQFLAEVDGPSIEAPPYAFQRYSLTATPPPGATKALCLIQFGGGGGFMANTDELFVDGAQLEQASAPTAFGSPTHFVDAAGNPFFYEVRIKNTVTVDLVGLTRELARITPAGITFAINSVATP